jgi:anti-sigma regulatory factor (Ser/Thr protein kinase)
MNMNAAGLGVEKLNLKGRLSDLARVPDWLAGLAARYAIPESLIFSIDLCLEEAAVNIILHGYGGDSDRPITLRFLSPADERFVFEVDDEARAFNPLDVPQKELATQLENVTIPGGHGIRLMRRFATKLDYEPLPVGNRLRLTFRADTSERTC